MNILIVDDHPINLKLLRAMLEAEGLTVFDAADGIEALAALASQPIDAIISDILMPRMDGYRLCREIRASPRFFTMPFIFYTATYTSPSDARFSIEIGADKFVKKPASIADLLAALREAKAAVHPAPIPIATSKELSLIKEYSERLVEKLEQKNTELEQSTADLQTTHEQLRQLLAHSPAVIYTLAFDGPTITPRVVSDNIEPLLGVSVAEASNYNWWLNSLHPDDRERVLAALSQATKMNGYVMEYRLRHKDGTYRWVEDANRVLHDPAGQPKTAIGLLSDITERKRAEDIVQKASTHRVQNLQKKIFTELAVLVVLVLSVYGLAVRFQWSENITRWISRQSFVEFDELVLCTLFATICFMLFALRRWNETKKEISGEQQAMGALKTLHDELDLRVQQRTAELTTANESLRAEIAERRKLQEEVTMREQRLNAFFGGATAGLAILDSDHRFVQINETLAEGNGPSVKEHLGRTLDEVLPKLAPTVNPIIRRVLKTGKPALNLNVSGETPKHPGVLRQWLGSYFPIMDSHGQPNAVGAIVVEITEQKRAEEKVLEQLDELRRWQSVMLDREDRVGQLKAEVNEVLASQGQPPRYSSEQPS